MLLSKWSFPYTNTWLGMEIRKLDFKAISNLIQQHGNNDDYNSLLFINEVNTRTIWSSSSTWAAVLQDSVFIFSVFSHIIEKERVSAREISFIPTLDSRAWRFAVYFIDA